ncbi:hypothetical protein [Natronobacterium texcoconense]|uniref:hypothetical protein n=1 Tax=Natronobacterium texcoconense TaxID=1095778 RepID=UPI00147EC535|nr:hypothetical protein [Natronobacterium texcoconense]
MTDADRDRFLASLRRTDAGPDVSDVIPIDDHFETFSDEEIDRLCEMVDED